MEPGRVGDTWALFADSTREDYQIDSTSREGQCENSSRVQEVSHTHEIRRYSC